jgi:vacuolar-type H+-ATPase subunit H
MKDEILSAVVEVEKEIVEKIAGEKKRTTEHLKQLREETEREISVEEERLRHALERSVSEACVKAKIKASRILEEAESDAAALTRISDEALKDILRKHIVRILP